MRVSLCSFPRWPSPLELFGQRLDGGVDFLVAHLGLLQGGRPRRGDLLGRTLGPGGRSCQLDLSGEILARLGLGRCGGLGLFDKLLVALVGCGVQFLLDLDELLGHRNAAIQPVDLLLDEMVALELGKLSESSFRREERVAASTSVFCTSS